MDSDYFSENQTLTADAALFSVLGSVQDFAATQPLVDDMSLVIVRRDLLRAAVPREMRAA